MYILCLAPLISFWILNKNPAKLFMGDVGSCFLGFIIGITLIINLHYNFKLGLSLSILMLYFILDAMLTLLIRFFVKREDITKAHNLHAYQNMSKYFNSHKIPNRIVMALNYLILLPLSISIYFDFLSITNGLFLAFIIVSGTILLFNPGNFIKNKIIL